MEELIKAHNVEYMQRNNPIIKNISWEMKRKQNWVLFGPNGSGKTTFLRMITGYIRPSSGKLSVLGKEIGHTNLPRLRKKIGWVSSSLESLIHKNDPVLEIVVAGFTGSTRMWEKPDEKYIQKAKRSLLDLGITENKFFLKYGLLSQGEQKKVLIARALVLEPELLILDEPCEGLDIGARETFLSDLERLDRIKQNVSILLVTHHVEEIIPIFQKILILKEGMVYKSGDIKQVLTSNCLSVLFGIHIELRQHNQRFQSSVLLKDSD